MSMLLPPRTTPATALCPPRSRRTTKLLAPFFTLTAIVFLILVVIGNTRANSVLGDIYFLRIDLSHIIPRSYPKAALANSITQTLGLSDFYQVGLWGYCQGNVGEGITYCSPPRALYSFDPVKILVSQLLAGAEVAIPPHIDHALNMARDVSHWMFGCFFAGIALSAIFFIVDLVNHNSYRILPLLAALIAGTTTMFITIAAVIATALFCVFRRVFENRPDLNIHGKLGVKMFVFMWLAVAASAAAFAVSCVVCCAHQGRCRHEGGDSKRKNYQKTVDGGESRVSRDTGEYENVSGGGSSSADTAVSSQAVVGGKPSLEPGPEDEQDEDEESKKLPMAPRPARGRFEERFSVPAPERFSVQGPYGYAL